MIHCQITIIGLGRSTNTQICRNLGEIEFHVPAEYQAEEECGCMVVLRYWQLFHNAQHNNLRGKAARVQVLKYYNRDNNKEVKGTENCDEEQTQQTRSRTALTHKGLLLDCFSIQ